jgi:hypothetical protein
MFSSFKKESETQQDNESKEEKNTFNIKEIEQDLFHIKSKDYSYDIKTKVFFLNFDERLWKIFVM